MIIKGRSPTNETCFTDPQSCCGLVVWQDQFGPKVQIRYIDSKLADILTKGNFTRDEWSKLLHLFNISHFSFPRCTKNFSLISWITMAKRIQEQTRRKGCVQFATSSDEYIFLSYCVKFLWRIKSDCIEKSGGVWSFGETRKQDESWSKFIRRSFRVSSEIKGCIPWRVEGRAAGEPDAWERTNFRRNWWFWIWALVLRACRSNKRNLWETTCKRNSRIHLFSVSEKSKQ